MAITAAGEGARRWAGGLLRRLVRTALPGVCPVTGEIVSEPGTLAPSAWAELALIDTDSRCDRCGREIPGAQPPARGDPPLICEPCHAERHPWTRGAAAMRYEGSGAALVMALKHRDRLELVPLLAGWMMRSGGHLVREADLVLPVPLHWRRLWARRHNQSAELARRLCTLAGRRGAFCPRLLRRVRATPPQGGRDRAGRAANVAGAFALAPGAAATLAGRRVLLVDDVLTTGATLSALTQLCLGAGAARVDVLVAALVTPDPGAYLSPGTEPAEGAERQEDGDGRG